MFYTPVKYTTTRSAFRRGLCYHSGTWRLWRQGWRVRVRRSLCCNWWFIWLLRYIGSLCSLGGFGVNGSHVTTYSLKYKVLKNIHSTGQLPYFIHVLCLHDDADVNMHDPNLPRPNSHFEIIMITMLRWHCCRDMLHKWIRCIIGVIFELCRHPPTLWR